MDVGVALIEKERIREMLAARSEREIRELWVLWDKLPGMADAILRLAGDDIRNKFYAVRVEWDRQSVAAIMGRPRG